MPAAHSFMQLGQKLLDSFRMQAQEVRAREGPSVQLPVRRQLVPGSHSSNLVGLGLILWNFIFGKKVYDRVHPAWSGYRHLRNLYSGLVESSLHTDAWLPYKFNRDKPRGVLGSR